MAKNRKDKNQLRRLLDESGDWFTPNTYDRNYKEIPDAPGVYLLVSYDQQFNPLVEYVGSSKNLKSRSSRHETFRFLRRIRRYVRFYFKPMETGYYAEEMRLIKLFQPQFNSQHNG